MRVLAVSILAFGLSAPAFAATQAEAEMAVAAAVKADAQAVPGNRWVPTVTALKAAQKALAAKDWDTAAAQAALAQALALRSVEQSKEQETAWQDAVIR